MKKQLSKKFYAFIVTAMLFSASANAQIVYTDVIPDSTSTGTYDLDLNNDGTNDFVITYSTQTTFCPPSYGPNSSIKVTPLGTNQVACYSASYATKMALNETINDSVLTWNSSANRLMAVRTLNNACRGITSGQWINTADGYLGLKLISGSSIYYGWARLRVARFVTSFTIMDYAYNSTPNQFILAGDTGTGTTGITNNSFASSIKLYPNPATNHLTIALGSINKNVELTIADLTGKIIYTATTDETDKIEVNTNEFAEGLYTVRIQTGEYIATKKILVKK